MHKNSYTSGFKLPRAFLIVAVLALSLELYLHSLEGKVFFRFFRSDSLYRSVQEAWRHDKIDIAIVGSSTSAVLGSDLPLSYFDNQHGKPIVGNFSLYHASPGATYRLLNEVVLERVKPKLIIYAFQPRDLSFDIENWHPGSWTDNKNIPELDLYKRSKMVYFMTSFFQQHCFTYRYRAEIRTWVSNNLFAINKNKRSVVVEDKSAPVGQGWEGLRKDYECAE